MPSVIAEGLAEPETPVSLSGGGWLLVEMGAGCVSRIDSRGAVERVAQTGRPNGATVDAAGAIWVAECLGAGNGDKPGLKRVGGDGRVEAVLDSWDGEAILWPNDIVVGPDGAIYFTDSGTSAADLIENLEEPNYEECDGRVFRYDPGRGELTVLDRGLAFANGIAFAPDGLMLVTESGPGLVHRYRVGENGSESKETGPGILDPELPRKTIAGTDGLAVGPDDRIYVALYGQGKIAVIDMEGELVRRFETGGALPTNCAFGPDGRLYVTECERGVLEAIDVL